MKQGVYSYDAPGLDRPLYPARPNCLRSDPCTHPRFVSLEGGITRYKALGGGWLSAFGTQGQPS